ncbi:12864_t:CDS:2, partial [Racocetra fulgida]
HILVVSSKDHKVITIQDFQEETNFQEETSSKKRKLSIDKSYDSDLNSDDSQYIRKMKK